MGLARLVAARRRRAEAPPARRRRQDLLKSKMRHGRLYLLVRWMGLDAAGEIQKPLDNLTNNEAAIAAFEQATVRSLPRPAPLTPPARRIRRQDTRSRRHRLATLARRWLAGR